MLKRSLVFILAVIALDRAIGFGLGQLYQQTLTGETTGAINFALAKAPDILILGSSRARHHINPAVLSRRLSMSSFNAGSDGQDFLYAMMLFDLWKRLHAPPCAILLHVDAKSFIRDEDELAKTSVFSYYIDQSALVRHIVFMRSWYEPLKFLSSAYRFNGKLLPILKNQFVAVHEHFDGYIGLSGQLLWQERSPNDEVETARQIAAEPFWQDKVQYFSDFADYCARHKIHLILVHSPIFREDPVAHAIWTGKLSRLLALHPYITFADISEQTYPEVFTGRADLYKDNAHLNVRGAELFSQLLATTLAGQLGRCARPLVSP